MTDWTIDLFNQQFLTSQRHFQTFSRGYEFVVSCFASFSSLVWQYWTSQTLILQKNAAIRLVECKFPAPPNASKVSGFYNTAK
jgi:hypothetical protein